MYKLPLGSIATAVGLLIVARNADPPSPEKLAGPAPATVAMIPSTEIRRTRLLPLSATYRAPFVAIARPLGPFS